MIEGVVNADLEATLTLTVEGPSGLSREFEAVLDTGYDGFLTLPLADVYELELNFLTMGRAYLADDSETLDPVHEASVHWDGRVLDEVEVDASGSSPLIGMALLADHDLFLEVVSDGRVTVERRGA